MINFFVISVIFFVSSIANGEPKEKVITVCKQTKQAYIHINTNFSTEEKDRTVFQLNDKPSGETYTLSKLLTVRDEKDQLLFLDSRYYNISYSSEVHPFLNWNLHEYMRERKDGLKVEVLNENNPLVIRTYYPRINDQTYFFNLDHQGNGTMSMVNTRWYSFMNAANNQQLIYAECKKP